MAEKKSKLAGLNIMLGVSGGIAVYKAVDLASKLVGAGAAVKTIMTQNASELVRPKSFEVITRSAVFTGLWENPEEYKISHINLADWADILVIAPATANIIGKAAGGICDDLLSTTLCACWQKPVLLAPAMNEKMWKNPVVQRNIQQVREMGFRSIGPETGRLACGTEGVGRMSEPQDILEAIIKIASEIKRKKR